MVVELNKEMKSVLLQDINSTRTLLQHLDDVKECYHEMSAQSAQNETPSNTNDLEKVARQLLEEDHEGETLLQTDFPVPDNIPDQAAPQAIEKSPPRRSARV